MLGQTRVVVAESAGGVDADSGTTEADCGSGCGGCGGCGGGSILAGVVVVVVVKVTPDPADSACDTAVPKSTD